MTTSQVIEAIDAEIDKLVQARTLLIEAASTDASVRKRGRPKGSTSQTNKPDELIKAKKPRRSIAAAGKARIAAAH